MIRDLNVHDFIYMLAAARWTVLLSVIAIVGGGVFGLLVALGRLCNIAVLRFAALCYIQFFEATPLLMQLFLVFFGGGLFGIRMQPWTAAVVAFSLNTSAFLGDIWHGSVEAVPGAQWEASRSLALSWGRTLLLVVAPQAARIAVPPTIGFLVQLIKSTSLASIIGFIELVRAGQFINNATLQPMLVYGFVGCVFFMLCWPLSKLSQGLETRLGRGFQAS